jgi:hypothetical protein
LIWDHRSPCHPPDSFDMRWVGSATPANVRQAHRNRQKVVFSLTSWVLRVSSNREPLHVKTRFFPAP